MAKSSYGENVQVEIRNNKLLIEIDLTKELGLSKSEKSMTIGTTRGNTKIPLSDGSTVTLGLNCYKPADKG